MRARPDGRAESARGRRRARPAQPPRLAEALYAWSVAGEFREFALGDLAQEYAERRATGAGSRTPISAMLRRACGPHPASAVRGALLMRRFSSVTRHR